MRLPSPATPLSFFFFLMLATLQAGAQTAPDSTWQYHGDPWDPWYINDFQTLVFADNATVRAAPDRTANKIATLPIATAVTVLAHDTARLTLDGRTHCWHQISWKDGNRAPQTGWIWGGLLAAGGATIPNGVILLGCMKGKISGRRPGFRYEVRVVQEGRLTTSYELPEVIPGESQIMRFEVTGARGLSNVDHVVHFTWAEAMCGGISSEFYLLQKGNSLHALPVLTTNGEMGIGEAQRYIFPDERATVEYSLPLLYFYEKPENASALLRYTAISSGDENGGSIKVEVEKVRY